jgi:hypothetical protein
LRALQAEGLSGHLPPPLEGWTREISEDAGAGLGFIGGGVAAEATYRGTGGSFTVTLMTDNPLVVQMGAMLGNRAKMAIMGEIVRVNGDTFLKQDDDLTELIGNRVLVQASGTDIHSMVHIWSRSISPCCRPSASDARLSDMKRPRIDDPGPVS